MSQKQICFWDYKLIEKRPARERLGTPLRVAFSTVLVQFLSMTRLGKIPIRFDPSFADVLKYSLLSGFARGRLAQR